MYKGLRVAVVVPAYNEARHVARTVAGVPGFVDHVIVVDDASIDGTAAEARAAARRNVTVLRHDENRGVGAAIVTGYRHALARRADAVAVMAGDGQMHPDDLPSLLDPLADGRADYAKGNRFAHPVETLRVMPRLRLVGNVALSLATRVTSGYWTLFDSQCGYTVATRGALEAIDLGRMFPRYGYPNDLLARLHAARLRVVDVPVRALYGPEWKSGISLKTVVYPISYVLARSLVRRLAVRWLRPVPVAAAVAPVGEAAAPSERCASGS